MSYEAEMTPQEDYDAERAQMTWEAEQEAAHHEAALDAAEAALVAAAERAQAAGAEYARLLTWEPECLVCQSAVRRKVPAPEHEQEYPPRPPIPAGLLAEAFSEVVDAHTALLRARIDVRVAEVEA